MKNKGYRDFFLRSDRALCVVIVLLMLIGLVMVTSSSMMMAEQKFSDPFYYLWRQGFYLLLGVFLAAMCYSISLARWSSYAPRLLWITLILLILVLIPGVGRMVNGSMRWLQIGPFGFQISELAKGAMILYMAFYLSQKAQLVRETIGGFLKPLGLLAALSVLLLLEPDFGATMVICGTTLLLLFLAEVSLYYFLSLLILLGCVAAVLIVAAPYRLQRLTSFLDPWAQPYDGGYQLTQALIAFGRGEWFGVGLGASMQKLSYLPEAHTDFLFAVFSEEFGLFGGFMILGLYGIFVARGLAIARLAAVKQRLFGSYVAYGITIWLGMQALINMGVNVGILPTKGLTLPFMSYGGSSLIMDCMAIGLLCRVDRENKQAGRL